MYPIWPLSFVPCTPKPANFSCSGAFASICFSLGSMVNHPMGKPALGYFALDDIPEKWSTTQKIHDPRPQIRDRSMLTRSSCGSRIQL